MVEAGRVYRIVDFHHIMPQARGKLCRVERISQEKGEEQFPVWIDIPGVGLYRTDEGSLEGPLDINPYPDNYYAVVSGETGSY